MAKKSLIVRNNLRSALIKKNSKKLSDLRLRLRQYISLSETYSIHDKFRKLRNSIKDRHVKRCAHTGRSRCVFKSGLCRQAIKYFFSRGIMLGTYKI